MLVRSGHAPLTPIYGNSVYVRKRFFFLPHTYVYGHVDSCVTTPKPGPHAKMLDCYVMAHSKGEVHPNIRCKRGVDGLWLCLIT